MASWLSGWALVALWPALARSADLASYVLPMTGTENGGNIFPGVSEPFGMIKLGPDMDSGGSSIVNSYSGYLGGSSAYFTGFSMLHESGTGGAPKYGVVSQMPVIGAVENPLERHADKRGSAADEASPGSYKAVTTAGITVQLAAASRAGLLEYTFPSSEQTNSIIVDVSHVLPSTKSELSQSYLGGSINVSSSDSALKYWGSGSYNKGWNLSPEWTVYFCGYFDAPNTVGTVETFVGADSSSSNVSQYPAGDAVPRTTARVGAVFSFNDTASVTSRVGVSFQSTEQACRNVDEQIPPSTQRTDLVEQTRSLWNDKVLSRVTTTDTANTTRLQLLYTSLYHMMLLPQNKTGENPRWSSSEPYYDDTFTLWDLHRCTTALLHVLQPTMYEEYIRSLVDIWRHDGFLPDGRSSFANGATQGGSNADNVLADAYVKGVRGSVNWEDAYAAMKTDAEEVPPNNNDSRDPSGSTKEGRGALPDWLKYGYITTAYGRSVSRAVEYAANDFGLFQVAKGLGKPEADTYLNRSRNWRNHWNPDATSLGFSGFVVPRDTAGFIEQDPLDCGGCYWGDDYYEALPWEYSFNAHHDMDRLIEYAGGDSVFVDHLETMFKPGLNTHFGSSAFNYTLFNPGNEPSFTTPFLFNYVGRQDLSVRYAHATADAYYGISPSGLPGNSDAGSMESWLLWVLLGLYPITGQTTFLIGSPYFSDLTVDLGDSKSLHIQATTSDDADNAIYVQSLSVNGQPWTQAWLTYDDIFASGGTLDFVLGSQPANWTTPGDRPPSPASDGVSTVLNSSSNSSSSTQPSVSENGVSRQGPSYTALLLFLCFTFASL